MTSQDGTVFTRDVVPIVLGSAFAVLFMLLLAYLIGRELLVSHILIETPFGVWSFIVLVFSAGLIRGAENLLIAADEDGGDFIIGFGATFTAYFLIFWLVVSPFLLMIFFGSPDDIPSYAESIEFINSMIFETVWGFIWVVPLLFISVLGGYSLKNKTKDDQLTSSKIRRIILGFDATLAGLPRAIANLSRQLGSAVMDWWAPVFFLLILLLSTYAVPLLELDILTLLPLILVIGGSPVLSFINAARNGSLGSSLAVGVVPTIWLSIVGVVKWYIEVSSTDWTQTVRSIPTISEFIAVDLIPLALVIGLGGALIGILVGKGYRRFIG